MITVVCVRQGEKFSPDYVNILYAGVKKNLDQFRFICVTDNGQYDDGIETVKLPENLAGWWGKLWLFSKDFQERCTERILFLDLDTIITGPLEELAKYNGEFCILRDFYRPDGYGSGLMAWNRGFGTHIWERWDGEGRPRIDGGDQAWIEKCVEKADLWQDIYPGKVCSYKVHAEQWPPNGTSIVCFHGFPKPHECEGGWVGLMWRKDGPSVPIMKDAPNTNSDYRLNNIRENVKRDLPWLHSYPAHNKSAVIVGGAPSLKENYKNIRDRQKRGQVIFSLNGTLDQLIERGITPDFHVMMDARPENAQFVSKGHDVEYLVNAVCHPDVFKALEGKNVTVWHSHIENEEEYVRILSEFKDKPWGIIGTGNTVGLTCMILALILGYRRLHLYGMDSSYSESEHHAYRQELNDGESVFSVWANNKEYKCSRWMMKQANDFQGIFRQLIAQGCTITAHGDGLLPDICRYMNEQVRHNLKERTEDARHIQDSRR